MGLAELDSRSLRLQVSPGQVGYSFGRLPRRKRPLVPFQRVLLKMAMPLIPILHLVVSPLLVISNLATMQMSAETQASAADFGSAPELAEPHLYVINPPGAMSFMGGLFQ